MFTPPPSPLPRDFGVSVLDTQHLPADGDSTSPSPSTSSSSLFPSPNSARSPGSLLSPGTPSTSGSPSSASLSPKPVPDTPTHTAHAFHHAASQSSPGIALARPPLGKQPPSSSSSRKSHARNSTIAVLAGDKAALARTVSQNTGSKKAQGRIMRLLAFAVPLLLVAMTVFAQRWRSSGVAHIVQAMAPVDAGLWRRQDNDGESTTGGSTSLSSSTNTDSAAATPTSGTATRVGDVPQAPGDSAQITLPTPFPQPFDSTLGSNFSTTSCTTFFSTFTQSKAFRSCRSFGMLLANSHAWFVAARDATPTSNVSGGMDTMNSLLWGTCHTPTPREECENTMAGLEGTIRTACKDELRANNAIAVAALVGFSNWKLYRDVGCIIRPQTNAYCYLEALNSATAEDAYIYTLPQGVDMKAPKPTCSRCSQLVLSKMREYAANATLPIAKTYPEAQNATSVLCGADYALPAVVLNEVAIGAAFAPFFALLLVLCSVFSLI